jgi:hypothetical protein
MTHLHGRWIAASLLTSVALGPLLVGTPAAAAENPVACSALAAWVQKEAGDALNKNPVSPSGSFTISSSTPVTSKVIGCLSARPFYDNPGRIAPEHGRWHCARERRRVQQCRP